MIRITKKFTFDAAHRLLGYAGNCSNIHGHTYTVHVKVKSERGKDKLDDLGMLVDFKALKDILQTGVIDDLDHSLMLHGDDPLFPILAKEQLKLFTCNGNPTAEYLAKLIFDRVFSLTRKLNIQPVNVVVFETPTSYAEYCI